MSLLSPNRLRARLEPHLHWKVPFTAGVYGNSPRWSNKGCYPDFLPFLRIGCGRGGEPLDLDPNLAP